MTIKVDCPRYWRSREETMRAFASTALDPVARMVLESTAETYKRLAERAERREQTGTE